MGYIEMATQEDAAKALMLNGQKMCTKHKACNCSGFPMKVKRSEAEKNWSAMKERAPPKIQPSTIRVCNLHPQLTRRDIIEVAMSRHAFIISSSKRWATWTTWTWISTSTNNSRAAPTSSSAVPVGPSESPHL